MKESYNEGVASHIVPESCVDNRKSIDEALTGVHADQVLSCEIRQFGMPMPLSYAEGNTVAGVTCESVSAPTQSKTLCMYGNSVRENREVPQVPAENRTSGWQGKATSHNPCTYACGNSDGCIVPAKLPNKGYQIQPAEVVEGRQPTKGNTQQASTLRTQGRAGVLNGLLRVQEAARRDKRARFTALLHHVDIDLLRESFYSLKKQASPGVDGLTWQQYEESLEQRLCDLYCQIHKGSYRAQPSRRTYIPKTDGRMRPLGVAALEDKIVQAAMVRVLNCIYEQDFLGFSYGFRPGRSQHDALDALWVGLMGKKVNWVLDADISGFYDTINHEWMRKFLEHRIADRRILRLIDKWLQAGVSEDGKWSRTDTGTPQGAVISPLIANVYLHYVFDLWAGQWRSKHAKGDVIIIRYADDSVIGFQHRDEAEKFLGLLRERMNSFGLSLHPDKTRLIEFGRFAATKRKRRGLGKPETFDFLGMTHMCATSKIRGRFIIRRTTTKKRLRAAIKDVKEILMRQRHAPVVQQGQWLASVMRGYFNYHAVPGNTQSIEAFSREVTHGWLHALRRRSQRHNMTWERFRKLIDLWLPRPRILHPYPNVRFFAKHPR